MSSEATAPIGDAIHRVSDLLQRRDLRPRDIRLERVTRADTHIHRQAQSVVSHDDHATIGILSDEITEEQAMTSPKHPVAPWRRLLTDITSDISAEDPTAAFAQLATVDCEGNPANRTVAVRGFRPGSDDLLISTDLRSRKIAQLRSRSTVALCWYLTAARQQFRIRGTIAIVDKTILSSSHRTVWRETWHSLGARTRSQFYGPEPGARLAPSTSRGPEENTKEHPPDSFALLIVTPHSVDHLNLRTTPHQRTMYWLDERNTWCAQKINP